MLIVKSQLFDEITENFGGGSPKPPPPPPVPTKADAARGVSMEASKRRKPQGYQSTILTGGAGVSNPQSALKTLLGS
jgi:hypothetical protein